MSNRDPDLGYRDLGQWGRFVCDGILRKARTALPGIVTGYDPNLRRARVIPALDMIFTDGTSMCHPVIVDVPVLWPGTGRWQMTFPLEDGDGVLLVFSARDLSGFKERMGVGSSGVGSDHVPVRRGGDPRFRES